MNEQWTPDEHRLSDALHEHASRVQPNAGGLAEIQARTSQAPWWRRPATLGVAVASATAGAVIAVALVVMSPDDSDTPVGVATSSSDSPSTTSSGKSPTSPETPTPEESVESSPESGPSTPSSQPPQPVVDDYVLPVYYEVPTAGGEYRLAREFHPTESAEPIADAVRQMFGSPADPDYATLWDPSTEVLSAARSTDTVFIDLRNPQTTTDSAEEDERAVQQLVYTATAATFAAHEESYSTVQILVEGEPQAVFDTVDLREPQTRTDQLSTRLLVQIDEPLSGERYESPVTVRGSAAAHEATLEWDVRDDDGTVVASDVTSTEECCRFSPFSFDLDLNPGTYTVEVRQTDPSGGEGPPPSSDTKTFTVVP